MTKKGVPDWFELDTGGKLELAIQVVKPIGGGGGGGGGGGPKSLKLKVKAQRGRNLKDTQTFGKQDPYCRAYLLPGETPDARTKCCEGGDTEPIWGVEHQPMLTLALPGEGESAKERLVVELWNENSMVDDLIGTIDMPLPGKETLNKPAKSKFYSLDTGGEVGLQISMTDR
jgi:hypothetical protein